MSEVLSEESCCRCGTSNITKERGHLCDLFLCGAGEGTRTHTRKAPDPKSGLSTNFNTPATRIAKVRKLADNANSAVAFRDTQKATALFTSPKATALLQGDRHLLRCHTNIRRYLPMSAP